jgi:uncharacterized protein YjbJ (UPF0337 family)
MGKRKRSGAEDALNKAVGRLAETAGTVSGDKSLEAEGRAAQKMGERKTYTVTTHAEGGWRVQAEGASRATSVHKSKDEAESSARELARNHQPSQLLVYKQDGTVQSEQTYG